MIVGFSLENISAEKQAAQPGQLNVNYNHNVTDVESADVSAFDDPVAAIAFEFQITYQQNDEAAADLSFSGNVLWQQDAEQVIDQWADEGTLPEAVGANVANHVFRKCLTQAVGLADSLDLPSPVPMPQVNQ